MVLKNIGRYTIEVLDSTGSTIVYGANDFALAGLVPLGEFETFKGLRLSAFAKDGQVVAIAYDGKLHAACFEMYRVTWRDAADGRVYDAKVSASETFRLFKLATATS